MIARFHLTVFREGAFNDVIVKRYGLPSRHRYVVESSLFKRTAAASSQEEQDTECWVKSRFVCESC